MLIFIAWTDNQTALCLFFRSFSVFVLLICLMLLCSVWDEFHPLLLKRDPVVWVSFWVYFTVKAYVNWVNDVSLILVACIHYETSEWVPLQVRNSGKTRVSSFWIQFAVLSFCLEAFFTACLFRVKCDRLFSWDHTLSSLIQLSSFFRAGLRLGPLPLLRWCIDCDASNLWSSLLSQLVCQVCLSSLHHLLVRLEWYICSLFSESSGMEFNPLTELSFTYKHCPAYFLSVIMYCNVKNLCRII